MNEQDLNIVQKDIQVPINLSQALRDEFEKLKSNNGGKLSMSEYVTEKELEKFEKMIDTKIENIEKEISKMPDILEQKFQNLLDNKVKEVTDERKRDKRQIITWVLSGTGIITTFGSLIVAILGLLGKVLNWY